MKIAVCDDQQHDREEINRLFSEYCVLRGLHCSLDAYASSGELLADGRFLEYHLIILDIYMDGGGGVNAAKAMRAAGYKGALVFITASIHHFSDGYLVDAAHYLVKPVTAQAFQEAMERAWRYMSGMEAPPKSLRLKGFKEDIPLNQIYYIEVYSHSVIIHTPQHQLKTRVPLNTLALQLTDSRFMRCHRSYIINLDYTEYLDEKAHQAVLTNKERIPVSRREWMNVKRGYMLHISQFLRRTAVSLHPG